MDLEVLLSYDSPWGVCAKVLTGNKSSCEELFAWLISHSCLTFLGSCWESWWLQEDSDSWMLWYTALTSCQRIAPSHDKQRKQLPKHMHNTCFFLLLCIVAMKFYFLFLYNSIAFFGRMIPSVWCPFTSSVAEVMAIKLWQQDSLPVRAVWGHFPCALCFSVLDQPSAVASTQLCIGTRPTPRHHPGTVLVSSTGEPAQLKGLWPKWCSKSSRHLSPSLRKLIYFSRFCRGHKRCRTAATRDCSTRKDFWTRKNIFNAICAVFLEGTFQFGKNRLLNIFPWIFLVARDDLDSGREISESYFALIHHAEWTRAGCHMKVNLHLSDS